MYAVNLKTAVCASKAALPHLIGAGGGRIVNIGAGASAKAGAGMGAYVASKAGVAKLTEALAEETKAQGITVNAVLPSIIDTAANRADMPKADFSKWVKPAAIAELIAFLLSEEAADITAALIPISGRV
jgi:NAD(P)-dependent dehydrogenase (short-subunit alcohol dehydrogenase family)